MNWVKESITRSNKTRNHYTMYEVDIFIKDALPKNIDPDLVFSYIKKQVPSYFFKDVDIIYVGQFDVFKEKQVNAIFQDGAIYVSNNQDSNQDLVDDIIHEIAHSAEEIYRDIIYSDQQLKNEFIGKRKKLYWILQSNGFKPYEKVANTYHYDKEIDMYFYKEVGYDTMWTIVSGLFPTPYSTTSLREYFAIGFEEFYTGAQTDLRKICPILFSKLSELNQLEG